MEGGKSEGTGTIRLIRQCGNIQQTEGVLSAWQSRQLGQALVMDFTAHTGALLYLSTYMVTPASAGTLSVLGQTAADALSKGSSFIKSRC